MISNTVGGISFVALRALKKDMLKTVQQQFVFSETVSVTLDGPQSSQGPGGSQTC